MESWQEFAYITEKNEIERMLFAAITILRDRYDADIHCEALYRPIAHTAHVDLDVNGNC